MLVVFHFALLLVHHWPSKHWPPLLIVGHAVWERTPATQAGVTVIVLGHLPSELKYWSFAYSVVGSGESFPVLELEGAVHCGPGDCQI